MSTISNTEAKVSPAIPADDPRRNLVVANPDNSNAQHLGVVGDTYTILLSGMDTAGRFTPDRYARSSRRRPSPASS